MPTTVLVVDDEKSYRDALTLALANEGYKVQTAANGQRALEIIEKLPIDLVLLDIMMPQLNGKEFLEKLNEEGRNIPCIVVSNMDQPEAYPGAVEYLIKANYTLGDVVTEVKKTIGMAEGLDASY
ncbi:response regulator [candidate division WWE3 bacterium]|uniref:Response regulator n=1 Tax=candidate division WWE3 bacterium TaxID=2053526 RepID=A0A955RS94_UNCKA|nr:response regulator [candidate division WWE3 bacterium]